MQYHIKVDETSGKRIPDMDPIPVPDRSLIEQKYKELDKVSLELARDPDAHEYRGRTLRKKIGDTNLSHEQIVAACTCVCGSTQKQYDT